MVRARGIFIGQHLADPQALPSLLRRTSPPPRFLARAALALALLTAPALAACGGGATHPARRPAAPGKIEALREAQERAQHKIEAEGETSAREAQRAQEAARREAEREAGERTGSTP